MTHEQRLKYSLNALPALVAVLLVVMMPRLEQWLFPVVRDFGVTSLIVTADSVEMSGYMRKVRDCKFIGVQALAVDGSGHEHDAPLIFLDAKNNNATRPQGTQGWGPWKVTIKTKDADSVRLVSTHRCHWVYANDTSLANIPLRGL